MSDSIDSKEVEQKQVEPKEEEGFVSQKAYQGVSKDMHRFKSEAKEAAARANELEERLKAIEEEKMRENSQWEELAQKRAEELEALQESVKQKEQRYVETAKRTRLKSELGNIRDEYLVHADLSSIVLNEDGSVNAESVHAAANEFREKHSVLIPKDSSSTSTSVPATKEPALSELSPEQLNEKLKNMSLSEKIDFMKSLQN